MAPALSLRTPPPCGPSGVEKPHRLGRAAAAWRPLFAPRGFCLENIFRAAAVGAPPRHKLALRRTKASVLHVFHSNATGGTARSLRTRCYLQLLLLTGHRLHRTRPLGVVLAAATLTANVFFLR